MNADALGLVLTSALRTGALAVIVLALLRLLRVRSSDVAHRVWTLVVVCGLAMPAAVSWSPTLELPIASEIGGSGAVRSVPVFPTRTTSPTPEAVQPDMAQSPPLLPRSSPSPRDSNSSAPLQGWAGRMYLLVVGALALRMLRGWVATRRLIRSSHPLRIGNTGVRVSDRVSVPVTTGILRPMVVLPSDWNFWPKARLAAVLEHERVHVERRDTLWAFLAHIHCLLFWFSPFAWWVDREVAQAAENVADDRAIRRLGATREYLRTLVLFAARRESVASTLGIGGRGRLDQRVERILTREAWAPESRFRRVAATATTLVVFMGVASCGLSDPPVQEIRWERSRQVAERNRQWIESISGPPQSGAPLDLSGTPEWDAYLDERRDRLKAQQRLIAELEGVVQAEPDNLDARTRLLVYYSTRLRPGLTQFESERGEHALWLIERDPGHELLSAAGRLVSDAMHLGDRGASSEAMQAADRLWRSHVAEPDAPPGVLDNAAYFFEHFDLPFAVDLLERADAIEPDPARSVRKGVLYGLVLGSRKVMPRAPNLDLGPVIANPFRIPRPTIDGMPGNVDRVYAAHVRDELERTRNVTLLESVAEMLVDPVVRETFDPASPGWRYVERALELDPDSVPANQLVVDRYRAVRGLAIERIIKGAWPQRTAYEAVQQAGPDWEFLYLLDVATDPSELVPSSVERSTARIRAFQGETVELAENLLALAPEFRDDPNYGAAVFFSHVLLGLEAGDDTEAAHHLLAAIEIPESQEVRYRPGTLWQFLYMRLVESGEAAAAAEFRDQFERMTVGQTFTFRMIDEFLAAND